MKAGRLVDIVLEGTTSDLAQRTARLRDVTPFSGGGGERQWESKGLVIWKHTPMVVVVGDLVR